MAANHISVASSEWGPRLKEYRNALELVLTKGPALLAKMNAMIDAVPDPDDYSQLEDQFGLQSGKGQSCWGELAITVTALKADPASSEAQAGDAAQLATKLKQFIDIVG